MAIILFIVVYLLSTTYNKFYYGNFNNELSTDKPITVTNDILVFLKTNLQELVTFRVYNLNHGTIIEIVWTVLPAFVLLLIAVPSFALLYAMDEIIDPSLTIKVIGHQ